jgi:hypothetical protein
MAQIIAQLSVFLLELGQAQGILARFRQQHLGGGIGAAVREFGWLGCRQNEPRCGSRQQRLYFIRLF